MEFDASRAPKESTHIWIIWDRLNPSIAAQIEQRRQENDTKEKLVKKAIEAEAKVILLSSFFVWDIDQRCPQDNCPAILTKFQTFSTYDPQDEPFKKSAKAKTLTFLAFRKLQDFWPKSFEEEKEEISPQAILKKFCVHSNH